jgi:predicted metal-binding membrane protein
VMNPLWIVLIAAFVIAEKVLPFGDRVAYAAGVGLIGCGLWMMATGTNVIY